LAKSTRFTSGLLARLIELGFADRGDEIDVIKLCGESLYISLK
jgi:hypothetical protein